MFSHLPPEIAQRMQEQLIEIPVKEETQKFIDEQDLERYRGFFAPDLYLKVPIVFAPAHRLTAVISFYPNFRGWMGSNWPENFVPVAIMQAVTSEETEILQQANSSDKEEFYAIDESDSNYPVYCWDHSVGFDKRFDDFATFIKHLVSKLPE